VEDLLVLARGDSAAGHFEPELVDLEGLLDDAARSAQAAFPQRAIDIEAYPMPPVLGDRDQLLRVVRNLVTNAAVHTQPGRPIRILGGPNGTGVTIQVVDGGPGLPSEEAAHVFERFWRADKARSRTKGGSGLGMAIVAQIVQTHGGTVRFDSSVPAGTTVTVLLPARPPAGQNWPGQQALPPHTSRQGPPPASWQGPPAPGPQPPPGQGPQPPPGQGPPPPPVHGQPPSLPPGWSADPVGAPAGYRPPPPTRQN
jgi:hypothetical protein